MHYDVVFFSSLLSWARPAQQTFVLWSKFNQPCLQSVGNLGELDVFLTDAGTLDANEAQRAAAIVRISVFVLEDIHLMYARPCGSQEPVVFQ